MNLKITVLKVVVRAGKFEVGRFWSEKTESGYDAKIMGRREKRRCIINGDTMCEFRGEHNNGTEPFRASSVIMLN